MAELNPLNEPKMAKSRSRGVALADESSDDLPALSAIAVGIAVIFVIVAPITVSSRNTVKADDPYPAHAVETTVGTVDPAQTTDSSAESLVDLAAIQQTLNSRGLPEVGLSLEGSVINVSGSVADESTKQAVTDVLAAHPGIAEVVDNMIVTPKLSGVVEIAASHGSITLKGELPNQPFVDELVDRTMTLYFADQIDAQQLVVNVDVSTPSVVTVTGAVADNVLHRSLETAFVGIVGIGDVDVSLLALAEFDDLGTALNNVEPVEFSSGSAVFLASSEATLAKVAELLADAPDARIEIGTHTDSLSSDRSNRELSQARSDSIKAALVKLGVTNDLVARGFGEARLKHEPDDTPDKQRENRRVEFRVLD